MIARAYVNGELTTEAEMKAKIVEKQLWINHCLMFILMLKLQKLL
jgi:hypothetical protein